MATLGLRVLVIILYVSFLHKKEEWTEAQMCHLSGVKCF